MTKSNDIIYPIPLLSIKPSEQPKPEWLNEYGKSHLYIVKSCTKRWVRGNKPIILNWWCVM